MTYSFLMQTAFSVAFSTHPARSVCTRKDFSGPPLRLGPLISTGASSSAFVGGRSLLSGLQAGVHSIPQRGHILVGAKGSSYFLIRYDGMIRRPQSDEEPRVANALP